MFYKDAERPVKRLLRTLSGNESSSSEAGERSRNRPESCCPVTPSPGAGTLVCRELPPPPPSSLHCASAGPACRTPAGGERVENEARSIKHILHSHSTVQCRTYLEEVPGGDEEWRVLLLVLGALLGQRRQSLQTQLADL